MLFVMIQSSRLMKYLHHKPIAIIRGILILIAMIIINHSQSAELPPLRDPGGMGEQLRFVSDRHATTKQVIQVENANAFNSKICRYPSSAGHCYRLKYYNPHAGNISKAHPIWTENKFISWFGRANRDAGFDFCEEINNPWQGSGSCFHIQTANYTTQRGRVCSTYIDSDNSEKTIPAIGTTRVAGNNCPPTITVTGSNPTTPNTNFSYQVNYSDPDPLAGRNFTITMSLSGNCTTTSTQSAILNTSSVNYYFRTNGASGNCTITFVGNDSFVNSNVVTKTVNYGCASGFVWDSGGNECVPETDPNDDCTQGETLLSNGDCQGECFLDYSPHSVQKMNDATKVLGLYGQGDYFVLEPNYWPYIEHYFVWNNRIVCTSPINVHTCTSDDITYGEGSAVGNLVSSYSNVESSSICKIRTP